MLLIKTLLRQILVPPGALLLFAAVGVLLQRYRPVLGRMIALTSLAILWALSLPLVGDCLSGLTEHYGPLDVDRPTDAQAIVILGGGGQTPFAPEYGGPATRSIMLEKVAYGAYVARKTGLPILVTGTGIEAVSMRETLARNFDTSVRWTEDQSRDTFENAEYTARLLRPERIRKIILITRSTHLYRSVQEFQAVGFEVIPAPESILSHQEHGSPQDFVPQASALLDSSLAIYELMGEQVRRLLAATHLRRHAPTP